MQTELTNLNAISVSTPENSLRIEKLQTRIQTEANFITQLEEHKACAESRLAYLEASNNGLGDRWVEANPSLFLKYKEMIGKP